MPVKASYLLLAGGGGVLVWSGINHKRVSDVFRNLIGGQSPMAARNANVVGGVNSASTVMPGTVNPSGIGLAVNGSSIAMDALQWTGHKYVYGGPSNPSTGWDCSSFVSWILGHDFALHIPGGTWAQVTNSGAGHGPVAAQYLTWSGAKNIPRSQVRAGDLLCWQTHVGFAADSQHMISAYDTADGTLVTGIDGAGPPLEILVCRRVIGALWLMPELLLRSLLVVSPLSTNGTGPGILTGKCQ